MLYAGHKELFMGKKYLIVMDIDGTLVDSNYRSTSPTIYSVIEQMQE